MAKKKATTKKSTVNNQRALVVGVSDYPRPEDKLPAVAADVREMAKVLASKNATFPAKGVSVLADRKATRDSVLAALNDAFGGSTAETVFVYMAIWPVMVSFRAASITTWPTTRRTKRAPCR